MKNLVQLIAYVDRMSGGGFGELNTLLNGSLDGVFGGVHLLPFFTPIDGADAGFDGRQVVVDGNLVENFDTSLFAPGEYVLQLVVTKNDGEALPACRVPAVKH